MMHDGQRSGTFVLIAALFAPIGAEAQTQERQTQEARSQEVLVPPNASAVPVALNTVPAKGEIVQQLGKSAMYVHHSKNNQYWFGSNDQGVYRYDGKVLINFTTRDGLVSNRIRGIQEDGKGRIYFTTYEGISRFDPKTLTFTTLEVSEDIPSTAWKLQSDDMWFVGAQDAGVVFRYDGQFLSRLKFPSTPLGDAHLANFPRSEFPNAIYSPYDVYCIEKDSQGNLWFGTSCVGVGCYDGGSFRWLTDPLLTEAPVRSILEDQKGRFWFTYTGQSTLDKPQPIDRNRPESPQIEGAIVAGMSIVEDGHGKLWIAALGAGVFCYDGDQKVHYPIREGTTAIEVFAVYKDNHGAVWLGTHNGGAYRFNGRTFDKFQLSAQRQ